MPQFPKLVEAKCAQCGKKHFVTAKRRRFVCDECARALIALDLSRSTLSALGISYSRLITLGKKPDYVVCDLCKREFLPSTITQRVCRQPGCISASFKKLPKITRSYEDTGESPAKIVICDNTRHYFDLLIESFPDAKVTINSLLALNKKVMSKLKGRHVKPSAMAAAIFYIIAKRNALRFADHPSQKEICECVECTEVTLRTYVKMAEDAEVEFKSLKP